MEIALIIIALYVFFEVRSVLKECRMWQHKSRKSINHIDIKG